MHLLEQKPDKINWNWLSRNSAICVYDYSAMKESKKAIHEDLPSLALCRSREPDPLRFSVPLELMQKMFHPKNINELLI